MEIIHNFGLKINKNKTWLLIFVFCIVYWAYLIFHTKMIIIFDSVEYENTGRFICQNGWLNFFQTGPHRELLYLALVAVSMAWAGFLSVDYQLVLKIFQIALLFSTQIFLIFLLRKINLREGIIKLSILYFGISPAIINAAFSVYYEIVVFPFVVAAVLITGALWSGILRRRGYRFVLVKSILFGFCFSFLALGRDMFQIIFYAFIFPFCVLGVVYFFKRQRTVFLRALTFISLAFIIFYSTISYVKTMNLRYNGEYTLSWSHSSNLLASAYKRSQPVTVRFIATNIALIPGTGVCSMFFPQQECDYADWYGMNQFRVGEVGEKLAKIPKQLQGRETIRLTIEKVIAHPFQYVFFSIVEALKMPFWESTKIGFVNYPEFLTKLYNNLIIRFGLRLLIGLMTLVSFIFVTCKLWRIRRQWLDSKEEQVGAASILFFTWLMITIYTLLYSTCYVIARYALPIAALFIVCIAFTINAAVTKILLRKAN